MKKQADDRRALALGLEWSSRITTVALEMVLPGLVGYWLDLKLGTRWAFLVLGVLLGFITGLMSLLRLTRSTEQNRDRHDG